MVGFEGQRPVGRAGFERLGEVESGGKQHFRVQRACLMRSLALAVPLGADGPSAASLVPTGTLRICLFYTLGCF